LRPRFPLYSRSRFELFKPPSRFCGVNDLHGPQIKWLISARRTSKFSGDLALFCAGELAPVAYQLNLVAEIAGDQAERAVEIGKKVVDAVADEARQQGLTAEGVAANARDLSGKVSRAADAAKKTTSQN
jgi:hypothetical protein